MKTKQIVGLMIAVALFIVTGAASVLTNVTAQKAVSEKVGDVLSGGYEFNAPNTDYIAVVKVEGTIEEQTELGAFETPQSYQHNTTLEYIDSLIIDPNNKGILLYVDSPGGSVYESEELYQKLMEYKQSTGSPVWAYMAHYAASGGYYISAAADTIYANENTVTGSIGVIMAGYDMSGLYEKLGIRYVSIASGKNKDSSSLSDEQIAIYQSQVDEAYGKFVQIVADGRGMTADEVKALADGRTYTANQALDNGLIDNIGSYEDMQSDMNEALEVYDFYEMETPQDTIANLFSMVEDAVPKSDSQVLTELAKEKSGGLMYYAEQLQ